MKNAKTLFGVMTACALVTIVGDAHAVCKKWVITSLTQCDIQPSTCVANIPQPLSEADDAYQHKIRYTQRYQTACQNWKVKGYGSGPYANAPLHIVVMAPDSVKCWLETNGPNNDTATSTMINFQIIPREACCETNLDGKGFHQFSPDTYWQENQTTGVVEEMEPEDGLEFQGESFPGHPSQKYLIRNENAAGVRGAYVSDLYRPHVPAAIQALEECGGVMETDHPNWRCRPQIDHIIPRVDKYGCACGSNAANNAQVISAGLNVDLSNYCGNGPMGQKRQAILNYYASRTSASFMPKQSPRILFAVQADESDYGPFVPRRRSTQIRFL